MVLKMHEHGCHTLLLSNNDPRLQSSEKITKQFFNMSRMTINHAKIKMCQKYK